MISWQGHVLKYYLLLKRLFSGQSGRLDVAKDRDDLDAMGRMFKPLSSVECSPIMINGVPAEWIIPSHMLGQRVVLYLHGGSFNSGSIVSHRSLAANIAAAGKSHALLIDYRLAPDHPFPAALEDALTAYQWLVDNAYAPNQIAVVGDSAGGTLVISLLVQLRDQGKPLPALGVCLSPATDLTLSGESWTSNAKKDLMLDSREIHTSVELYLSGTDPRSPLASPLYADLHGLSPLLIQVGSDEVLLSDSTQLAEKAKATGVDVTLEVWEGMQHVWQFAASFLPEGKRAIARIGEFMDAIFSKTDEHI
jgi:acetyl esterase/lipase